MLTSLFVSQACVSGSCSRGHAHTEAMGFLYLRTFDKDAQHLGLDTSPLRPLLPRQAEAHSVLLLGSEGSRLST